MGGKGLDDIRDYFGGLTSCSGGSKGGYEGCAGRVPRGFRRGFRRVSEGVSEGFPWVSGGFREKVNIKRITEIIGFAKP